MLFKSLITLSLLTSALALPTPQLAGTGAMFDSLFTELDNGIGYGVKNAETNLAGVVGGAKGGAGTGPAPGKPSRRQLNKISDGFQTLSQAAGTGASTTQLTNGLDAIDGDLTDGQANLGAALGETLEKTLADTGNTV